MPKSVPDKAKRYLHDIWHDIWQAETRVDAEATVDFLVATDTVKDHKAIARRARDRDVLPAFHDFPAEHWKPIRTALLHNLACVWTSPYPSPYPRRI